MSTPTPDVTVSETATNMYLRVSDGNGHTGDSGLLDVLQGHVITASSGPHGTVSPSGEVFVPGGQDLGFEVAASAYYHVDNIATNGEPIVGPFGMSDTNYVWLNVTTSGTFLASFAENRTVHDTPEWWLASHGFTNRPWSAEDVDDPDEDGMATWKEYVAGTCPTNFMECLRVTDLRTGPDVDGRPAVITWDTITGRYYTVRAATDLVSSWTNVAESAYTNIMGTGLPMSYTNRSQDGAVFLRLKVRKP
jgi:hypothetical protein